MDQNLLTDYETQRSLQEEKRCEESRMNAWIFGKLALPSLFYALVYTFCVYKNTTGITVPLWIAATIGYACYGISMVGKKVKRDSIFLTVVMMLLGISTFLTGNEWIIWMNYAGFFLLLICFLLRNLKETMNWDLGKYVTETFAAVMGTLVDVSKPFLDGNDFWKMRQKKENTKGRYIVFGICLAIPCILFLGMLLMSADAVFADLVSRLFENFRLPSRIAGIVFMILFGFFSSYCGIRYLTREGKHREPKERKVGEPVLAITVTGAIAALYLIFCGIQVLYLFIGKMQLPKHMSYAEYARQGFFQLLFVCIINLVVVLEVEKYFQKNRILNGILLVISACTMIMTASSAWRMILYIGAYRLTFLRVAVLVALFAIALLMGGTVVYILRPAFPLLKYEVTVVSVVYLAFAFSHVDYFIASYNLAQLEKESRVDFEYINAYLSTDAAPAIASYLKENPEGKNGADDGNASDYPVNQKTWYQEYLMRNREHWENMTLRSFNLSYFIAEKVLE